MAVCTFFGHRDCPASIRPKLRAVLTELIERRGAVQFYVGRQGAFDAMAHAVLRELSGDYPHISCAVVLERLPGRQEIAGPAAFGTIFPEGLETVPPRFAIDRRNAWMLRQADLVVAYVTRSHGGAARFAAQAVRLHKPVFNLAALPERQEKT